MTDEATLAFFAMTPGELLAKVLARENIQKADFGRMVGADYQKAHRWTKDIGFGPRNRRIAEKALKLPAGYFDRPDDDDAAREREAHRRKVFAEFLDTDMAKRFDRNVLDAINATPVPVGRRATLDFYSALALVFAGQLSEKEMQENIDWNERESHEITAKSTPRRKKG